MLMDRLRRGVVASVVVSGMSMVTSLSIAVLHAENWPQWRGPGGRGVSTERDLPSIWEPGKNIAWKVELPGGGHSSPVVWGDRIFITTVIEGEPLTGAKAVEHIQGGKPWVHPDSVAANLKHTFKVLALDATTGKILWDQTAYEGVVYDARHRKSSFAGPTPATDGTMVYAYFGPEGLYAYDAAGKLVWKAVEKFPTLGLGTGTSPVLFRDLVIVQRDEDNGEKSAIVAYDKKTGAEVWRTKRDIDISWGTPVLIEESGRPELVTNGSDQIIAYDPATGKELWRTKGVQSNAIHTPVVGNGLVIVTAGFPVKRVIAIRPGSVADDKRVAWEYSRGTGYVVSNIFYDGLLYLFSDNGIVTCLDAETGAVKYEGGRVPVPARFMGSPVAFGGYIAMTSEDGDTFMLKAGPSHEIVRTNSVDEPVFSSLAISNGRIYIRAQKHLYAIGS
jgi:outer membrane protein assembly factor BamB